MDKFGFFKLLNSFLPPAEPKNDASEVKNDALSNFLNSFSEQNFNKNTEQSVGQSGTQNQSPQQKTQQPQKHCPPPRPLQASMLNVMNSHDEFIKRVQSRNKQPNS